MIMMTSTEDFSFPTEFLASISTIDSPPLWRSSPAACSPARDHSCQEDQTTTKGEEEEEEEEEEERKYGDDTRVGPTKRVDILNQRSFSCIQTSVRKMAKRGTDRGSGGDEIGEEKMDLLWENLNEDLARSRSSRFGDSGEFIHGDRQIVEFGCVQAIKKSRTRNSNNNKPAMVMVWKVLKKLFLIHSNSHHHHFRNHQRHHNKLRASRAW